MPLDIESYMHKPFFDRGHPLHDHDHPHNSMCPEFHHVKPKYTMTEEVEHTARLMRETIDRLIKFEKRVKGEIADLSKNVMSDNVIFKNAMHESWTTFLMEVKNEVNIFEATVNADIEMFKAQIESDYATLRDDVNERIAENLATFNQKLTEYVNQYQESFDAFVANINSRLDEFNANHAQAFADFQRHITTELNTFEQTMTTNYETFVESVNTTLHTFKDTWETIINERLAAQDGRISDAEMYMKTNLEATITTLIGDMHANGDFSEIIQGEVFNDLQRKVDGLGYISVLYFGARGDGEFDNSAAIQLAVNTVRNGVIYFPRGVYLVGEDIDIPSETHIVGGTNAVIKRIGNRLDKYAIFNIENAENVTIENLAIEGERYEHETTTGQHGVGVNIANSRRVTIKNCHISECWGDGITVGGTTDNFSEHVEIVDCFIDINRRNGISFIGGVAHSRVCGCEIMNNGGTAPSLGIDFETWVAGLVNREITVNGCRFKDNPSGGLTLFEYNSNIRVYDCDFDRALSVKVNDAYVNTLDAHPSDVEIFGNRFEAGVYIFRAVYGSFTIHDNIFNGGNIVAEHTVNVHADDAKQFAAKTIHGNVFNGAGCAVNIGNNANVSIVGNIANDCGLFFEGYGLFNSVVKDNIVNGYNVNNDKGYIFRLNGICDNVAIEDNTVITSAESNDVSLLFSVGGGSVTNSRICDNNTFGANFDRFAQFGAFNNNLVKGNTSPSEYLPEADEAFAGMIVTYIRSGVPTPMICVHNGSGYIWTPVVTINTAAPA
ncbi:right-handed parallel beta-helix repeat-containing protein [bacterium]|nr:right-handed parallel beta-helix repeat-containing protein [bacterium]